MCVFNDTDNNNGDDYNNINDTNNNIIIVTNWQKHFKTKEDLLVLRLDSKFAPLLGHCLCVAYVQHNLLRFLPCFRFVGVFFVFSFLFLISLLHTLLVIKEIKRERIKLPVTSLIHPWQNII